MVLMRWLPLMFRDKILAALKKLADVEMKLLIANSMALPQIGAIITAMAVNLDVFKRLKPI